MCFHVTIYETNQKHPLQIPSTRNINNSGIFIPASFEHLMASLIFILLTCFSCAPGCPATTTLRLSLSFLSKSNRFVIKSCQVATETLIDLFAYELVSPTPGVRMVENRRLTCCCAADIVAFPLEAIINL